MMRRKYNPSLQNWLRTVAINYTVKELLPIVNKEFPDKFEENELRKLLVRNRIEYKKEQPNKSNNSCALPIGSEYVKPDGMTLVKVNKRDWVYKQRKVYEDYYNIKLKDNEYIVFLDHNRKNFDIKNLKKISRRVSGIMANEGLFSSNKDITELGITAATLVAKTKDYKIKEENNENKRI